MNEWPPSGREGWQRRPLPPQPVHHEPGYPGPPRPAESPWRRSQRQSHAQDPETQGPHYPQGPHEPQDPRDTGGFTYLESQAGDEYGDERGYEHEEPGRFMPGFGGDDGDDGEAGGPPARPAPAGRPPRRPRRRRFRWLAPLAAVLVIIVPLAVGGAYAYRFYMSKYHPPDYPGSGTGRVVVQVVSGDNATSLAPRLARLGVVASSRAFVLAAEHSRSQAVLVPGFYGLRAHMKASLAYAALLNPKDLVQITVTIPEGWRVSQVMSMLGAKSGIPASAYASVLKNPAQLHLPSYANGNPEGYLFPATYAVQPHETALGVLTGMVHSFDQEAATANLTAAARQLHMNPGEVITMASLVQAEGGKTSDYAKIARVIYNRLARHMPLQLDSTVLYGLHKFGIIASDKDLASPSPYNTYKNKGLPPGPIDSPGDKAIQAVLHPAPGPWLYFVTVNPQTGETKFTSSLAQFEQFRAELQHHLGKH